MAKLSLFTYHVILHPEEAEEGKKQGTSELIIEPTYVLAKDQESLAFKVAREIDEKYVNDFERIEIGIAPFNERAKGKADLSSMTVGHGTTTHIVDDSWKVLNGENYQGRMPLFTTTGGSGIGVYHSASKTIAGDANL